MKALMPLIFASILCTATAFAKDYQISIQTTFVANPKIYGSYKSRNALMHLRGRQLDWQMPGSMVFNKQKLVFLQLPLNGKMAATSLQFKRLKRNYWKIPAAGQERALANIYLPYIKKAMDYRGPRNWQQLPNEIVVRDVSCQAIARSVLCQTSATVRVITPQKVVTRKAPARLGRSS